MKECLQAHVAIIEMIDSGEKQKFIAETTDLSPEIIRNCYNNVSRRFQAYDTAERIMMFYSMWRLEMAHHV